MKKSLSILVISCAVLLLVAALSVSVFALTQNNGVYEIASAEDLVEFRNKYANGEIADGVTAVLTKDIDMSKTTWIPFGTVKFNFDGQGHTISGLTTAKRTGKGNFGLFIDTVSNSYPTCYTVKNIKFVDCSMEVDATGSSNVGLVAGYADRAAVYGMEVVNGDVTVADTVEVSETVGASELIVGTIVGRIEWDHTSYGYNMVGGKVDSQSSLTVTGTGTLRVAGIAGASGNTALRVMDSKFEGTINCTSSAALVHDCWGTIYFKNCELTTNNYKLYGYAASLQLIASSADGLIEAIEYVNTVNKGVWITLDDNIDMTGKTWAPIAESYTGVFDGANKTIKNITYTANSDAENNALLVTKGTSGGAVKNLKLENCSYTVTASNGQAAVGLVVGYADRFPIENVELTNCSVNVTYTGTGKTRTGMVAGSVCWSSRSGSWGNEIPVSATVNTGCTLTVTATNGGTTNVGGIVGHHWGDVMILTDSVSNATITAPQAAAYVYELDDAVYINDCTTTNTALNMTGNEAKRARLIYTAQDLLDVIALINGGNANIWVSIEDDIDMTGKEWTPITVNYKGIFNGQENTISNISKVYDNQNGGNYALIANVISNNPGNGTIKNLTLKDCSLTVNAAENAGNELNVGAIAGRSDRGHIENCHLKNVDIVVGDGFTGSVFVGGILGCALYSGPKDAAITVYNCSLDTASSVTANVPTATDKVCVAGILGLHWTGDKLYIKDCVNNAAITSSYIAGGIYGRSDGGSAESAITNCKNYGTVKSGNYAGGIIGFIKNGTFAIENCVSGGFIFGTNTNAITTSGTYTENNNTNIAVINPATTENITAFYQTTNVVNGTFATRVVFLTKLAYLEGVDKLTVTVTFKKGDATVKTHTGELSDAKMDYKVYSQLDAAGHYYNAPADIVIFGNEFWNIPEGAYDAIEVTVTNGAGAVVYTNATNN